MSNLKFRSQMERMIQLGKLCKTFAGARGAFKNYVDKISDFFNPPFPPVRQRNTMCIFYFLLLGKNFVITPLPPLALRNK